MTVAMIYDNFQVRMLPAWQAFDDSVDSIEVERTARRLAAEHGRPMCIMWKSQESDNEKGYWWRGAKIDVPRWYQRRRARAEKYKGARHAVILSADQWERAKLLGNGKATAGVRRALALSDAQTHPIKVEEVEEVEDWR